MSRNQKAPLLAFVLVALVCGLILVDSMRGEAFERRVSVLAPTPVQLPVTPAGREPQPTSGEQAATAEPPAGSPGDLADAFDPFRLLQGSASTGGSALGSMGAFAEGLPDASSSQTDEDASTEQASSTPGTNDGPRRGLRGHRNPHAAQHGPGGGRPDDQAEQQQPTVAAGAGGNGPTGPDDGDRDDDADPGPDDHPDEAGPRDETPPGLEDGHDKRTVEKAHKRHRPHASDKRGHGHHQTKAKAKSKAKSKK